MLSVAMHKNNYILSFVSTYIITGIKSKVVGTCSTVLFLVGATIVGCKAYNKLQSVSVFPFPLVIVAMHKHTHLL